MTKQIVRVKSAPGLVWKKRRNDVFEARWQAKQSAIDKGFAGAQLEDVRHAATHSNISMTQRYSRGAEEKTAKVMQLRVEHRTKNER